MILPSRPFGVIASSRPRVSAGGDVTPDSVNWDDILYADDCANYVFTTNTAKQITGISQPITLKISWSNGSLSSIGYKKSTSPFSGNQYSGVGGPPDIFTDRGYTPISNNGLITDVNDGDYIGFFPNYGPNGVLISVLNNSNGDVVIDSFSQYYDGDYCFGPP
jgi:hypothetical protein